MCVLDYLQRRRERACMCAHMCLCWGVLDILQKSDKRGWAMVRRLWRTEDETHGVAFSSASSYEVFKIYMFLDKERGRQGEERETGCVRVFVLAGF